MTTYVFETPIVREGPAGGHRLFHFYKLNRGISIVKDAGVYKQVRYLVDEDLRAWTDIHDWMRGLSGGVDDKEWTRENRKLASNPENPLQQYADGILTIYSALNNPRIRIKYANMFPTELSDIKFDSTQGADTILTATAKFRFDFFNIERLTT
jgi:hypothetical protein